MQTKPHVRCFLSQLSTLLTEQSHTHYSLSNFIKQAGGRVEFIGLVIKEDCRRTGIVLEVCDGTATVTCFIQNNSHPHTSHLGKTLLFRARCGTNVMWVEGSMEVKTAIPEAHWIIKTVHLQKSLYPSMWQSLKQTRQYKINSLVTNFPEKSSSLIDQLPCEFGSEVIANPMDLVTQGMVFYHSTRRIFGKHNSPLFITAIKQILSATSDTSIGYHYQYIWNRLNEMGFESKRKFILKALFTLSSVPNKTGITQTSFKMFSLHKS